MLKYERTEKYKCLHNEDLYNRLGIVIKLWLMEG